MPQISLRLTIQHHINGAPVIEAEVVMHTDASGGDELTINDTTTFDLLKPKLVNDGGNVRMAYSTIAHTVTKDSDPHLWPLLIAAVSDDLDEIIEDNYAEIYRQHRAQRVHRHVEAAE